MRRVSLQAVRIHRRCAAVRDPARVSAAGCGKYAAKSASHRPCRDRPWVHEPGQPCACATLPNAPVFRSSGAAARHRIRRSPRRALALARPRPARPRRPSHGGPLPRCGQSAWRGTCVARPLCARLSCSRSLAGLGRTRVIPTSRWQWGSGRCRCTARCYASFAMSTGRHSRWIWDIGQGLAETVPRCSR